MKLILFSVVVAAFMVVARSQNPLLECYQCSKNAPNEGDHGGSCYKVNELTGRSVKDVEHQNFCGMCTTIMGI
jgi:hypothetical protein